MPEKRLGFATPGLSSMKTLLGSKLAVVGHKSLVVEAIEAPAGGPNSSITEAFLAIKSPRTR